MLIENHDWNVIVRHIYKEANTYVDKLAKHGHNLPVGLVIFDRLPPLHLCLSFWRTQLVTVVLGWCMLNFFLSLDPAVYQK